MYIIYVCMYVCMYVYMKPYFLFIFYKYVILPDTLKLYKSMLVSISVMAYMEMFGNCSHSNNDFISGLGTRHSMAAYNSMQAEWQQHEMALTTTQSCSFMAHTITTLHDSSKYVI